jgi:hypothetical protein
LLNNINTVPSDFEIIWPTVAPDNPKIRVDNIDKSEIKDTAGLLKSNKAPGSDESITAELLKNGGDCIIEIILLICIAVYNGAQPPWQWTTNQICPVPKKGIYP